MIMGKRYQSSSCEVVVRPAGAAVETRWLVVAALVTVLVCAVAILLRHHSAGAGPVPGWQVDAFAELRPVELAVFNSLYTAAPEIELSHEMEGGWPTVDQLAANLLPPFVQDAAWEKNGAMAWIRTVISTTDEHIALYLGNPGHGDESGSLLLVMLHNHVKKEGNAGAEAHAPYEIWLHASSAAGTPDMITDQALINMGWRQVVARKGDRETRRAKEDFIQ